MPVPSHDTGKSVEMYSPLLPARFWEKVMPITESGCWVWTGAVNDKGYGQFRISQLRTAVYAHRLAYSTLIGEIPKGLELDHLCKVPCCCNPLHLEPVTHAENIKRGWWANKDTCSAGHLYENNTYLTKEHGHRVCLICKRAGEKRRYHNRRNNHASSIS